MGVFSYRTGRGFADQLVKQPPGSPQSLHVPLQHIVGVRLDHPELVTPRRREDVEHRAVGELQGTGAIVVEGIRTDTAGEATARLGRR